ncbi:MAG: 30S ribosomal protein S12 methylthiotransferase RimO [Planctomycetota bacterium]
MPGDPDIKTVSFVSLGCPKNLVDSEKMLGLLAADGIAPVSAGAGANREDLSVAGSEQDASTEPEIDPADAVVINTCGFLEASKQESLATIQAAVRAKERGEVKRVVVAGCLVQRHRAKMLDWEPGIDAMLGVYDRERVIEAVRGGRPERTGVDDAGAVAPYWISRNALHAAEKAGVETIGLTIDGKRGRGLGYYESDAARLRLTPRHYAYLRISEGCNQHCAFCTIPSIRGRMRSKPREAIVAEARELIRDGAFELLLIGQDTTSYGEDLGLAGDASGLAALVRELSDVATQEAGAGWLRLMYAYPSTFPDEMIEAFAELVEHGRLLPYLDIPLQHASDAMLSAMDRRVTAAQQRDLCLKLRDRVPGMAIRTTFITGFPGETDDDHAELMEFVEEIGFDAVGVFTYSPEDTTRAGKMANDAALAVPGEVAEARKSELLELQQRIVFEQNAYLAEQFDPDTPEHSGVVLDVLIDGEAGAEGEMRVFRGRLSGQAPGIDAATLVASREAPATGELVRCTITGWNGYDLVATPTNELVRRVSLPVLS